MGELGEKQIIKANISTTKGWDTLDKTLLILTCNFQE